MARFIDADKFNKDLQSEYHGMISDESLKIYKIIQRIDDTPTADVVEVVRCKDCKHRHKTAFRSYCMPVYGLKQITDLNSYCSYGERKEGAKSEQE